MIEKYRTTMTGEVLRAWAADADAELAALRKDAERYRWLRHGDNDERCIRLTSEGQPYMMRGAMLDGSIDAAMAFDAATEAHTVKGPGVGAA